MTGLSRPSTPKPATCTSPAPIPRRLQSPPRHRARDRAHHRRVRSPPANAPDGPTASSCLAGEAPGLQVLADGAYGSGETLAALAQGRDTIRRSSPARLHVGGSRWASDRDDFVVDHAGRHRHLPGRLTSSRSPRADHASFGALMQGLSRFEIAAPHHRSGRTLHLHPHDDELVESRRAWQEGDVT